MHTEDYIKIREESGIKKRLTDIEFVTFRLFKSNQEFQVRTRKSAVFLKQI